MNNLSDEKTLYLFIDESGNFDFSPNGTKYFVLSSTATFKPCLYKEEILDFKYKLLKDGHNQEFFHATEDAQFIRDKIFEFIEKTGAYLEIDSVIAQKNKANPSLYCESYKKKGRIINRQVGAKLYERTCYILLQYIFRRYQTTGQVDKIVVVLGSVFPKEKEKIVLKTLKTYFKHQFKKPFEIYFHNAKSDLNCQIADYCCWAISIKWERQETRPYQLLENKNIIKSEFDLFQRGFNTYYDYK